MASSQSVDSTRNRRTQKNEMLENIFNGMIRGVAGVVSDMLSFEHCGKVSKQAHPGDLIEIERSFYSHYALYLGNGLVMNIDAEDNTITEARIRERRLEDVCEGSNCRIRNLDEIARQYFQASPKPIDDIILSAKSFEEELVPYQFDFRNCEYYCTLWRYGVGFSTQAAKPTSTPIAAFVGEVAKASPYAEAYNTTANFLDGDGFAKYKQLVKTPATATVVKIDYEETET